MEEEIIDFTESNGIFEGFNSDTRKLILSILSKNDGLSISDLSRKIKQTGSNASTQIKILEKSGLVYSRYEEGTRGVKKACYLGIKRITLDMVYGIETKNGLKKINKKLIIVV